MILIQDENYSIVTQEKATIVELVKKIQESYSKMKNHNIIVNLATLNKPNSQDMLEFLELSNRNSKHSFVIVSHNYDLDDSIDDIIVVPTLQEAYDIIEMEEIERDLGF